MVQRVIETERDRELLIRFLNDRDLPITVSIADGGRRSTKQNRLNRLWMNEISEQMDGWSPEYARAYCKLTIGVPILRAENEVFCERYDAVVKPMPYETKMDLMMEPLDFPVTRLMTVRQQTKYLDGVHRHFSEKGILLTDPGDLLEGAEKPQDEQETPKTDDHPSETETRLHESAPDEQPSGEVFNPSSPAEGDGPIHPHSKPGSSSSLNSEAHSSSRDASDAGAGTPPLPAPAPIQECAIKIMGIAIDPMFETKEQRRYALETVKDDWKAALPESDWPVLKDLVTSSYDCVKGDADYAAAVQHFAKELKIPADAFHGDVDG